MQLFTFLLLDAVLLLLLQHAHSVQNLQAGERCYAIGQCAYGLACVASSSRSKIAHCQVVSDGCSVFGCNVVLGKCDCKYETDCLASFEFNSRKKCQQYLAIEGSQCDLTLCPELQCDPGLQYTPEGQCCPMCPHIYTYTPVSGCTESDGTHYKEGETWRKTTDPCVTCTCLSRTPLCWSVQCAAPPCADYITLPGDCCPMCPTSAMASSLVSFYQPAPASTTCHTRNEVYKNGEIWFPDKKDPCLQAYCDNGDILYLSRQCRIPNCARPIYSPDTCCPSCPAGDNLASLRAVLQNAINDGNLTLGSLPSSNNPSPSLPLIPLTSSCRASNGDMMKDGDNWCPLPHIKCECSSGTKSCSYHCPPVSCSNRINGQRGTCDCPYCLGGQVEIATILEMPFKEYTANDQFIQEVLESLVSASGLSLKEIAASQYSPEQTHAVMTIHADDPGATEDSVLNAIHKQMYGPANELLTVGSLAEYPQRN